MSFASIGMWYIEKSNIRIKLILHSHHNVESMALDLVEPYKVSQDIVSNWP